MSRTEEGLGLSLGGRVAPRRGYAGNPRAADTYDGRGARPALVGAGPADAIPGEETSIPTTAGPTSTRSAPARAIALAAAALVALLPAALAVLHARTPSGAAHVEAEHDPDRCRWLHDHDACLVVGANPPTPPPAAPAVVDAAPRSSRPVSAARPRPAGAGETPTRRPRAPPAPA